jgi:dinuclear metal center YbgI/SA1388 family protein
MTKIISRHEITTFLDAKLRLVDYKDHSLNGVQVEADHGNSATVTLVAGAVDAALSTIDAAAERGAQLLVVHHGLFWGRCEPISGVLGRRIQSLIRSGCSLYAAHLPLDGDLELGNAALLARYLELNQITPAFLEGGQTIGVVAAPKKPLPRQTLVASLERLRTGHPALCLPFGSDQIKKIGIVTGSGSSFIMEALRLGCDTFISGEPKQSVYHEAKDLGINAIFAGHYATETFGVRAVLKSLEQKFGVATEFIAEETGI